jgi:NADH dehydrogenase
VLLARATAIDVARRVVVLEEGELAYDWLIVATGAVGHWFGHDEWAQHALGLKDCRDALEIRARTLLAFEAAEREDDGRARERLLTFVVIGGGPTGVELAGALAEIARVTLARDFRRFDPSSARIVLVEGGPRVLAAFPEDLSRKAERTLERLGVVVRTGKAVTSIDERGVALGDERIDAATVLWAAGVRASVLVARRPVDRGGRCRSSRPLRLEPSRSR